MPRGRRKGVKSVAAIFDAFVGNLGVMIKEKVAEAVASATTDFLAARFGGTVFAGEAKPKRRRRRRRGRKPGPKPGRRPGRKPGPKPGRPRKRRPGRPKGSKNKPKPESAPAEGGTTA
ncbi:MAG: hypothetical protein HY897_23785 [Deltaproteobacteria bacterium]|nr:hypothetical protein [Deltaproteobacteria bacterium]